MQQIFVSGNLGDDATVREVNGDRVINFSLAHNERYTDAQGIQHERTTWHNCSYWRRGQQSVEVAKYLGKGAQVLVIGTVKARAYTKGGGVEQAASLDVTVAKLELLGGGKQQHGPVQGDQQAQPSQQTQQPTNAPF